MFIESVEIKNYRSHPELQLSFKQRFTVITGTNGSGKTSILKALAELMGVVTLHISGVGANSFNEPNYSHIKTLKINGRYRVEKQFPVTVKAKIIKQDQTLVASVTKSNEVDVARFDGAGAFSRTVFPNLLHLDTSSTDRETMPVLAFYRSGRKWVADSHNMFDAATQKVAKIDAYKNYNNCGINGKDLESWLISKCLERYQQSSETGMLFDQIQDDELAITNRALSSAIENIGSIRYDMSQKSLIVDFKARHNSPSEAIVFENLSDGQRAVIYLITDISRRMCILNPHLGKDVSKATPGLILIDEIDIHLHPKWQRQIIAGLKDAFPLVQIITTTHSPQILGEMKPDEIILLSHNETSTPRASYGLDSGQILQEIMDSPARNIETEANLERLFKAIESGEKEEALRLFSELEENSPELPELSRARSLMKRIETIGR